MVEDSLAQDVLNKTSDQPVWPLGYADPAMTPWEPGLKTKTKIKKKKGRNISGHTLQETQTTESVPARQTSQQTNKPAPTITLVSRRIQNLEFLYYMKWFVFNPKFWDYKETECNP